MDINFDNLYIDIEELNADASIIRVIDLNNENIQKCEDYIKDQIDDGKVKLSFGLPVDDEFYIDDTFDMISINSFLILLRKLVLFLNRTNINWQGSSFGIKLIRKNNEKYLLIPVGPGFIVINKSKCILVYTDGNNINNHEFSLMGKL